MVSSLVIKGLNSVIIRELRYEEVRGWLRVEFKGSFCNDLEVRKDSLSFRFKRIWFIRN